MYDLPKKEDALLYQSKGKAAVGRAPSHLYGTPSGTLVSGGTWDLDPHHPRQS